MLPQILDLKTRSFGTSYADDRHRRRYRHRSVVASGKTISTAGPGGAIVAYGLIGIMVLFLMQSLGEMAAHLPVPGSFQTYATRYVSSSSGLPWGGTTGLTGQSPSRPSS